MPNKNIVNYEKLKTIFEALWNKIKEQFIKSARLEDNTLKFEKGNGSIVDVNLKPILKANNIDYNDVNTNLGLDNVQEVLEYLEKDKASLNKDNVFIGENTFNEVILMGKTPFAYASGALQSSTHKANVYCGLRTASTHSQNPQTGKQYVSSIKIRITNSLNVGDFVKGVCVTEITKRTNKTDDIVGKTIVDNGTFIVEKDADYEKCIYVPVQKEYSNDTYFLIGQRDNSSLREFYISPSEQCINNLQINSLPQEGSELGNTDANGWIIAHALVSDDINVREALASTTALDGKVDKTDVGNEDNKIPRLENGKLVEKIIPEIAITRIIDATDQANALDKANSGDIQVGDSVRLTGEQNKVYQYTGIEVGDFTDRFIEISQGNETVRTINTHKPELNGNFQFTLEETVDKVKLQVGRQDIAEVNFATTQEITELKDLLVFR